MFASIMFNIFRRIPTLFFWILPVLFFLFVRVIMCHVYEEEFTLFGTYPRGVSYYMPTEESDLHLIVKHLLSLFSRSL
jgi:hypothetical protein